MENAEKISKSFLAYELQTCLKPVIGKLKSSGLRINLSSAKREHVNVLSQLFGDNSEIPTSDRKGKRKIFHACSLKKLCKTAMQKITKDHLNIIIAENMFPDELESWYRQCPFGKHIDIQGMNCQGIKTWYSYPEYNDSVGFYVFMILDAYHQLCGLRRLFCANGIPAAGISHKRLHKVAEESETNDSGLNTALVHDLIDKQSVAYAIQTFSERVERALLRDGATNEARFCSLIRHWYLAEDEPGISVSERCKYRLQLREWLLQDVNFCQFPPRGAYVKDIPIVLYEGLLTGIERRLQLFPLTKTGSYNVRCIGSLDIENFFGSFQDYDPWGTGVLRPDSIPTAISVARS